MTETRSGDLIATLDEASLSRFHLRAVLVSGMGFFTDAHDLFVIGIASTLVAKLSAPRGFPGRRSGQGAGCAGCEVHIQVAAHEALLLGQAVGLPVDPGPRP
jgi:hypothetical protein